VWEGGWVNGWVGVGVLQEQLQDGLQWCREGSKEWDRGVGPLVGRHRWGPGDSNMLTSVCRCLVSSDNRPAAVPAAAIIGRWLSPTPALQRRMRAALTRSWACTASTESALGRC
jgi:hypothetical protein